MSKNKDKDKEQETITSKLLSENTASVSLSDITKGSGILSAEYHINNLKGQKPYILKNNKYTTPAPHEIKDAIYLTAVQVKGANNLLYAKKEIEAEIVRILKNPKYKFDESIEESKLSERAKNACYNMINLAKANNKVMLSDIAMIPVKEWRNKRGMGEGTEKEIQNYLTKNGFTLLK